jgi:hypothetical protein
MSRENPWPSTSISSVAPRGLRANNWSAWWHSGPRCRFFDGRDCKALIEYPPKRRRIEARDDPVFSDCPRDRSGILYLARKHPHISSSIRIMAAGCHTHEQCENRCRFVASHFVASKSVFP